MWQKIQYNRKLTASQIQDIQSHYNSDEISFPRPDKKFADKRFMRKNVAKS